jgi:hypothetical protein
MRMRRLPFYVLLLGCGGMLLGIEGCTTSTAKLGDGDTRHAILVPNEDKQEGTGAPFKLPSDLAGKLLTRVLPPSARPGRLDNPDRPSPPALPSPRLTEPTATLPSVSSDTPRLRDMVKRSPMLPELVQPESLDESFDPPQVPGRHSFAIGKLAHVPSDDVAMPPPMPVLAQPVPDRVSLDDVTTEVSTAAVLAAPLPVRTTPAPYQRMIVPEPFENRLPLTLEVPAELTVPESHSTRPTK